MYNITTTELQMLIPFIKRKKILLLRVEGVAENRISHLSFVQFSYIMPEDYVKERHSLLVLMHRFQTFI